MLAPDQFAAPLKSLVATFIVKDLLMNDRVSIFKILYKEYSFSLVSYSASPWENIWHADSAFCIWLSIDFLM